MSERVGGGPLGVAIPRVSARRQALALLELTKPRIAMLVVMTGVPALLLAAHGFPDARVFWGTLIGTVLAASSAASFNMYFDRDIDALLRRTSRRPLPAGVLPPASALALGFALAAAAWWVLASTSNLLAAAIGLVSIFYYAIVYTVWLKRRTAQNIVIGGGAGASAPLIAWAAVTGHLSWAAVMLAGIIFLWTPPHFWALSLFRREDYERAGVPMLPVVRGEAETRVQILLYTLVLVPVTIAAAPVVALGRLYVVSAAVLGALFLWGAVRVLRQSAPNAPMRLFHFSIIYLFLLYLMMTADALIGAIQRAA